MAPFQGHRPKQNVIEPTVFALKALYTARCDLSRTYGDKFHCPIVITPRTQTHFLRKKAIPMADKILIVGKRAVPSSLPRPERQNLNVFEGANREIGLCLMKAFAEKKWTLFGSVCPQTFKDKDPSVKDASRPM